MAPLYSYRDPITGVLIAQGMQTQLDVPALLAAGDIEQLERYPQLGTHVEER